MVLPLLKILNPRSENGGDRHENNRNEEDTKILQPRNLGKQVLCETGSSTVSIRVVLHSVLPTLRPKSRASLSPARIVDPADNAGTPLIAVGRYISYFRHFFSIGVLSSRSKRLPSFLYCLQNEVS
jgi:hypothetical protein